MDIALKILMAKNFAWIIRERIKNERIRIQNERPNAKPYIEGAIDSEEKLCKIELVIIDLESEVRMLNRECNQLALKNGELRQRILELENQIKYNQIENQI